MPVRRRRQTDEFEVSFVFDLIISRSSWEKVTKSLSKFALVWTKWMNQQNSAIRDIQISIQNKNVAEVV